MIKHHQSGVGMIEVLITLLVLSIGLLGLAGLQAASLRNNQSAYMRTQAVFLAYDIFDRMRVNQNGVENGDYDSISTATLPGDPGCLASSGGCSPAELAAIDTLQWGTDLSALLPSGQGTVVVNADGSHTVTIMWDDDRSGATGTGCDPDAASDMKCLPVTTQVF